MILGEELPARLARCIVASSEKYLRYEQTATPRTEYIVSSEHTHQVVFEMIDGRRFTVYVSEVSPDNGVDE